MLQVQIEFTAGGSDLQLLARCRKRERAGVNTAAPDSQNPECEAPKRSLIESKQHAAPEEMLSHVSLFAQGHAWKAKVLKTVVYKFKVPGLTLVLLSKDLIVDVLADAEVGVGAVVPPRVRPVV